MSTLTTRISRLEQAGHDTAPSRPWVKLRLDTDATDEAAQIEALHARGFNVIVRTIVDPPKQPRC